MTKPYLNLQRGWVLLALGFLVCLDLRAWAQNVAPVPLTPDEKAWLAQHPLPRVGSVPAWAPISMQDDEGNLSGIAADYVHLLEERLDTKLQLSYGMPWSEVLDMARKRELDVIALLGKNAERDTYLDFTEVIIDLPYVIIARADSPDIDKLSELEHKKVAVAKNFIAHEWLKSVHPKLQLVPKLNSAQALEAVILGEADAYIGDIATAGHAIHRLGLGTLKVAGKTDFVNQLRIGVRSDWPELVSILNKGLASITPKERQDIWNKWVPFAPSGVNVRVVWALGGGLLMVIVLVLVVGNRRLRLAHATMEAQVHERTLELAAANAELRKQAQELEMQQEVLQHSNVELEERAQLLEVQREQINLKNQEIERVADALRTKAQAHERTSRYKSEFLANMSHELRTPLNSIMILSSLLMQNKELSLNAKQVEFATIIHHAGNDLLALINDILDLSKIETGKLQMHFTQVAIAAVCGDLHALFDQLAQQKNLDFSIRIDAALPATFQADALRVQQILKNLLSNAFKFTPSGSIRCDIYLPKASENPLPVPAIAFCVKDTGMGVAADKHQQIFRAFEQADGSISRKHGGTGLGLSISVQLARRMNGDILLASEEGRGSAFTLYLPVENPQASSAASGSDIPVIEKVEPPSVIERLHAQAFKPDAGFKGLDTVKILLVDDDMRSLFALSGLLSGVGLEVVAAESGMVALERLEEHADIRLVLMDIMLSQMSGYDAIRAISRHAQFGKIPIVAMTAKALIGDREKCLAAGANDYLSKPIDGDKLLSLIRAWV